MATNVTSVAESSEESGSTSFDATLAVFEMVPPGVPGYARYNRFPGEYLGHLDREEQVLEKALWDHFTDEELMGIDAAIEHSVSPAAMEGYLSAMCVSFSPDELAKILGGMKAFAPPEVTEWALGIAKQAAPPAVWAKVSATLA